MTWKRQFARLRGVFSGRRRASELRNEIRAHIAMEEEENVEAGMPSEEAHYAALRRFGNMTLAQERSREMWAWNWVETFLQDIRYGFRQLRRSPGFAAVSVLTLALGLAASAAIFSVINGVLLQPLGYANPGQLVAIQLLVPGWANKFPMVPLNPATYLAWSHQAKSLAGIAVADQGETMNLTGGGEPALLSADAVTAKLFDVLRARPQLGRNFLPDADQAGHNHEVILTNKLWQSRFHGDPGILGHMIVLNGSPYSVAGILPPSFHFPTQGELNPVFAGSVEADLYVPLVFEEEDLASDAGFGLDTIARLRPGVSRAQAVADLNVILSRQFRSLPSELRPKTVMMPLREMIVRSSKGGLWLLLAAVLAVLLIICLNLANLALTRSTARAHEAAIRSALGASRGRLLRQSLTETLLLGLAGGGLGLLLAHWALRMLLTIMPASLPRLHNVRLDGAVV